MLIIDCNPCTYKHALINVITMIFFNTGNPDFTGSPADVHASMNSYILHHNLSKAKEASDGASLENSQDTVGIYSRSTAV